MVMAYETVIDYQVACGITTVNLNQLLHVVSINFKSSDLVTKAETNRFGQMEIKGTYK